MLDVLIRSAEICDGTAAPRFTGDIAIHHGQVVAVGRVEDRARHVVEANGLFAAPGFIDVHTHYDCQISWDPQLTPSGWHGVTTVVLGNCGFTIAPCHPSDRELLMQMLLYVEGMPTSALAAGIHWEWTSFPEYLATLQRWQPALNVAAFVGHSAIRYFVMRDAASRRPATDDELMAMRQLLSEAMQAGAWGFSSSQSPTHFFGDGTPVPSRVASRDELRILAAALRPFERGVIEIAPEHLLGTAEDKIQDQQFYAVLAQAAGKVVSWAPLLHNPFEPQGALRVIDNAAHLQASALRVVPQVGCRPLEVRVTFGSSSIATENNPFWRPILAKPLAERTELLKSRPFRDELRALSSGGGWVAALGPSWTQIFLRWSPSANHLDWIDRSVADIAAARATDEVDTLLDLSLETNLACQWGIPIMNTDEEIVGQLLRHPAGLLALSDAGAHVDTLADHSFTTHLLGHWVRDRGLLSWEEAVRLLTSVPARLYGIPNRGELRPGFAADVVLFDPKRVAPGRTELWNDLPGGAHRLVQPAVGVEYVFVNGVAIVEQGKATMQRPGIVLRSTHGAAA